MTKKHRIIASVLWSCAAAFMMAGGIMLAFGVRPLLNYLGDLTNLINGGDVPAFPAIGEFVVAIVGLVLFVVGAILMYVAGTMTKSYRGEVREDSVGDRLRASVDKILASRQTDKAPEPAAHGFCARCGHAVENPEHRFCPYCGARLVSPDALQSAEDTPVHAPVSEGFDDGDGDLPVVDTSEEPANWGLRGTVVCGYCGSKYRKGEEVCLLCGRKLDNE